MELDKFIKQIDGFGKKRVPVDLHELTKAYSPESVDSKKGTAQVAGSASVASSAQAGGHTSVSGGPGGEGDTGAGGGGGGGV